MQRYFTFDTGEKSCHLELSHAHPYVLSGGSPGRIRKVKEFLDDPELIESDRGLVTIHGLYKGLPVTAFSTGMGPASVALTLPEVIEACDADAMYIIRLGTAGALKKEINVGDFVITTDVQADESTSKKIIDKSYELTWANTNILRHLRQAAEEHKLPFQKIYSGPTRTVDEAYFDALDSQGKDFGSLLAVSMEFSVYCALRDRYRQEAIRGREVLRDFYVGEILAISNNNILKAEQVDMSAYQRNKLPIELTHIKIGLEALLALSKR